MTADVFVHIELVKSLDQELVHLITPFWLTPMAGPIFNCEIVKPKSSRSVLQNLSVAQIVLCKIDPAPGISSQRVGHIHTYIYDSFH